MTEVRIAGRRYRIEAVEQSGAWLAHAERVDTGDGVVVLTFAERIRTERNAALGAARQ